MRHSAHLARRFIGSLSRRAPSDSDTAWAVGYLLAAEAVLWQRMAVQDRRHSILVARRFVALTAQPTPPEVAGALLHDVGKTVSGLGTLSRVVATVIGPRTKRFLCYHEHETLGAELLRTAGSDPATVALLDGTSPATQALRDADAV